jgi:hypothetical protein
MKIQSHYCPDSLDKLHAHIDGLSAIMRLYKPKKNDAPLIALIYGQHQKFRVVSEPLWQISMSMTRMYR